MTCSQVRLPVSCLAGYRGAAKGDIAAVEGCDRAA